MGLEIDGDRMGIEHMQTFEEALLRRKFAPFCQK